MDQPQHKDSLERIVEAPAVALDKAANFSRKIAHSEMVDVPLHKAEEYWRSLGPGFTTGAADDDPSGITTYTQAGAQYGFNMLWLSTFTFPLMAVVQEICARLGMVTGQGLAGNIKDKFPRWAIITCTGLLFAANTFNISADLQAMAAVTQLMIPGINLSYLLIGFTVISLFLPIFTTYKEYAKYLKWLALILFAYVFSALLTNLDWAEIFSHAVRPNLSFSQTEFIMITAILGTTISPYLFFWQTSQEVEEEILEGRESVELRRGSSPAEIKKMRLDVWSGMFISNLVMFFIIAAAGVTLHAAGITNVATAAEAAEALRPLAGDWSYFLFSLGIIGTGLLAVPILAGSASYAIAETFNWKNGLYLKLNDAYAFYGVIIISMLVGLGLTFFNLDPIKALIYSAVFNGLVAPVVLVFIMLLSDQEEIMGDWVNSRLTSFIGWLVTGLMILSGLVTLVSLAL